MPSALMRTFMLVCLIAITALAGPGEMGSPSLRVFLPREYGAQNQNWAIVQDPRGVIYVGNGEGVLEFDGVRWRLIPTQAHSAVRCLAVGPNGRIYVGAVGEVGYLAPDAQGRTTYVSLNDRIDRAHARFSDVWTIHPTSRGIYFFTRDFVFLLGPEGFRSWHPEGPMHYAFGVGDRFLVQQVDGGLCEVEDQAFVPLPGGSAFRHDRVYFILPWDPPQPGRPSKLLVGTRNRGLLFWEGANVTPFRTGADPFLMRHLLYQGVFLPDGTLALSTLQGGMALVGRDGRLRMIVDKRTGLPDTSVYALHPDRQGGLWMGLGSGLARLQWPSAFSHFDAASGLEGTVLALQRHQGTLYAGTSQGLFRLEPQSGGQMPRFRPVQGLQAQIWDLHPAGDALLVSNYQGLFELQKGRARLLQGGTNAFLARIDPRNGLRVYVGLVGGLATLHRAAPGAPWVMEGILPSVPETIRSMEDAGGGRIWLGTSGPETLRVRFPGATPNSPGHPEVERFGPAQGLPAQHGVKVARVGGQVVFTTNQGIYAFNEASGTFRPDPRFSQCFQGGPKRVLLLQEDAQGRVWMETHNPSANQYEMSLGTPAGGGAYQWEKTPFQRFGHSEMTALLPESDGIVWLGSAEGLNRFDPAIPVDGAQDFRAMVRAVSSRNGNLLDGGGLGWDRKGAQLKTGDNALRFEFASTAFDDDWANQYQVCLEGHDSGWSPWGSTPFKEYAYLPDGDYVFKVRARNAAGALSQEGRWAFTIPTPWRRSWWAFGLYAASLASVVLAGYAVLTRLLRRRNASLQLKVDEATRELKAREERLAIQARDLARANEDLVSINEQKNQFIGIVAHDLRNPINGILLASEMLEDLAEAPPVVSTARMIQAECQDMHTLIGRFLDISAIEAGTIKSEPAPCSLADLARQVASRHALRAEQKGIRIRLELASDARTAFVDPNFAKEILDNLLSNAVKFSPSDTTVTVRLENHEQGLHLTVQDEGPGLTAQDQTKVFKRFTKLSATPTGGERSLGLGLSIVKHMVDALGGKIWIVSAPGEGSAFHVTFPAAL